jgi:hypothetical protein
MVPGDLHSGRLDGIHRALIAEIRPIVAETHDLSFRAGGGLSTTSR